MGKKRSKKILAIFLTFVMLFTLIPGVAMASDGDEQSRVVYLTVSLNGELVKDKDGNLMAQRKLVVPDENGDNAVTIDEVMRYAHEQYYTDGAAGYASADGTATKLWGAEKGSDSIQFGINDIITGLTSDTTFEVPETVENFQISAALFSAETTSYTSRFVGNVPKAFGASPVLPSVVLKDTELPLKLVYMGASSFSAKFLSGYKASAYTVDADTVAISSAISDKNGLLTVAFPNVGTYVLTAEPTATATIRASVPACLVTVVEETPKYSAFQMAADEDLQAPFTLEPAFSPEEDEYTVSIPEGLDSAYVSLSLKDDLEGLVWRSAVLADGKWGTMEATGHEFGSASYLSLSDNTRGLRIYMVNPWNPNVVLHTSTLTVKRLPALSGISVEGFAKDAFDPNGNSYEVYINPNQESVDITPVAKNEAYTVTVAGQPVAGGQTIALPLSGLTFDGNNKAKVPVVVHAEGEQYADNTYTLVLEKEPVLETPTILLQPEGADYIQNGTAASLKLYASAGGALSYQWYNNMAESNEGGHLIDGATNAAYMPSTETVGTAYYYCVVTNTATGKAAASDAVRIVVDPDPTPTAQWNVEVPEVASEHQALFEDFTRGFYYKQGEANPTPLKITASSAAPGGQYNYYWLTKSISAGHSDFTSDGIYTPKTDQVYGLQWVTCEVRYTYKGVKYSTKVSDPIAIYVDKADVGYPDEIKNAWTGDGTTESPWQLKNQEDLTKLKGFVDQGYDFADIHFKMSQNITLDNTWDSIGGGSSDGNGANLKPFSGTLDGGGFTLTYAEGADKPLFRYVREAAVRNLDIYAPYFKKTLLVSDYVVDYGVDGDYNTGTGGSYAPGCPDTIDIENVTVKSGSWVKAGGFIDGGASGGNVVNIRNCVIERGVTMGKDKVTGEISDSMASFAGRMCGTVVNCVSYADLYSTGSASGIISGKSQSMGMFYVINCGFLGSITSTGSYVGGIMGKGYMSDTAPNTPCVTIQNCYVNAALKGADKVGGIFGGEPSSVQNWSPSYIRNNHFYGTVEATAENGSVGGIIGYMNSLNKNNVIENNFYLEGCGAERAIGGARYVDTSCETHETTNGAIYFNTGKAKPSITGVEKTDQNRADDPLGKDSEKLAKPVTAAEMANGSVTNLLNKGEGSLKNWIQGEQYPVISDKPVAYELGISGTYKDTYYIGDTLDLSGIIFTAQWSDGSVTKPSLSDVKITGFNSSERAVLLLTASYGAARTEFLVTVLKPATPEKTEIQVSFTLLGDKIHDSDVDGKTHTLRSGNLETWIPKTTYTVKINATAENVFRKALSDADMEFKGNANNQYKTLYVSGIQVPGTSDWLSEFTNGPRSGWMYTLNGTHPDIGLSQQFLEDGDAIVFHYTDDYTKEEGSEKWNSKSSTGAADRTVEPKATVSNGKASVSLALSDMKDAIGNAKSGDDEIIIAPKVSGTVNSMEVALKNDALSAIVNQTKCPLTVNTPVGNMMIPHSALASIASQAGGNTVTVIIDVVDKKSLIEEQQKLVGENAVFDISITSGGKNISSFDGKSLTISLPYALKDGETADGVTVWYLNDKGELEKIACKYDKAAGLATFTTTHLSRYLVGYSKAWQNPFADVKSTDWFYGAVEFAAGHSLFNGTSATTFSPNSQMTRAMLVTVLYRMDQTANAATGSTAAASGSVSFTDVKDGQWYTDAVAWANANGIVTGIGNGLFGTNNNVTREQMATILYNYAKYRGYDIAIPADAGMEDFTDAPAISGWAQIPMKWANSEKLITGRTAATLVPGGSATRAEVATILKRFAEGVAK